MSATELQLQTGPYRTTYRGTEITRASTKNEWVNYGEILKRVDEAKQWAIGDWLVDGKRHYGDGLYDEAEKILGYDKGSLQNFKSISDSFQISLRNENLTWNHHKEVSSIKQLEIVYSENQSPLQEISDKGTPTKHTKTIKQVTSSKEASEVKGKMRLSDKPDMPKIQEFLIRAEKEKLSVRELREVINQYKRRQQEEIRLYNEPKKYPIILADPAWEYDFSVSDSRKIENQYLPTSLDDMKRLRLPAADNCVLFMWATSPKLREALDLMLSWGFEYKTCAIWEKDQIGMGYYFRQKHELLLVGGKGTLQLPDDNKKPESVFHAPRTEHSEKPDIVYQIIETMYPSYKKLEMFARKAREGWDVWGDELKPEVERQ